MSIARVYTEFQPLEEVIIGKSYDPSNASQLGELSDAKTQNMMEMILRETEEDLQLLVNFLEDMNIIVKRPEMPFDMFINDLTTPSIDFRKMNWLYSYPPITPRDMAGVYGETIIEFFSKTNSRYFSNWPYQNIFMDYFKDGADWLSIPMPQLEGTIDYPSDRKYEEINKILFHAANIIKCGKDIFYTGVRPNHWQGKGTSFGEEWIKRVLGKEFDLHPIHSGGHADGKMAILKPGVVSCWKPDVLPDKMKNWDKIIFPDTRGEFSEQFEEMRNQNCYSDFIEIYFDDFIGNCNETVGEINSFSVNEGLVITNGFHKETTQQLRKLGIDVWPWDFRHRYFWDSAAHCVTLDTRRRGDKEDYFS